MLVEGITIELFPLYVLALYLIFKEITEFIRPSCIMLIPVWCICRFLSSVSLLAQRRNLLEDIIITKNFSEEGLYQVCLCKDGNWKTVIVDDRFPCDKNGNLKYSRVSAVLSIECQIHNCTSPKQGCHNYHVIYLKICLAWLKP